MLWKILIAHAPGEEHWAEILAEPLRQAGYEVSHSGTVLVGSSLVEEAAKTLSLGGPLVLCATVRAVGTRWARTLVNAARSQGTRVFIVQMEKEADVEALSFGEKSVAYWRDPAQAIVDLIDSLQTHYSALPRPRSGAETEQRYRDLMLKAYNFIDLASLPEADHRFNQAPELWQLYVPLRLKVKKNADLSSIGAQLAKTRRLIVLGEPGAGKSTLIRWLAAAYLLRMKPPLSWRGLPDAKTLPVEDLMPVVISCRDLDPVTASGPLEEILRQTLRMAELSKEDVDILLVRLGDRLRSGRVLLLFDGLDALTDLQVRIRLARQIEKIAMAYEQIPIVVTSRPAGYWEMGFRLSPGFEHAQLAELSRPDKEHFASLWFALTEPRLDRQKQEKDALIREIHSTTRIERLTGNPMLLTAIALMKNNVGRLPQRRADLYGEIVRLLLNRRPGAGEPILPEEALPQLEYLAYAMCDRGMQQVTEREILTFLGSLRYERPDVAWLRAHSPLEFLRSLERHTGILRRAGERRDLGMTVPVFELPHPTVQEYLAARALVSGYLPGSSPDQSLADRVGPLAGRTVLLSNGETAVSEHWREILRLCAACCGEAVEDVLLAILRPQPGEDASTTARSRAILASLCLADAPGVSEETAQEILRGLAQQVSNLEGNALARTSLDTAILELAETHWVSRLKLALTQEFQRREPVDRWGIGFIFLKLAGLQLLQGADPSEQDPAIFSDWEQDGIARALNVIGSAYGEEVAATPDLVGRLMEMLSESPPAAHAAAWALLSLLNSHKKAWRPSSSEIDRIISLVEKPDLDPGAAWGLIKILGRKNVTRAMDTLIKRLHDPNPDIQKTTEDALRRIAPQESVEALLDKPRGNS